MTELRKIEKKERSAEKKRKSLESVSNDLLVNVGKTILEICKEYKILFLEKDLAALGDYLVYTDDNGFFIVDLDSTLVSDEIYFIETALIVASLDMRKEVHKIIDVKFLDRQAGVSFENIKHYTHLYAMTLDDNYLNRTEIETAKYKKYKSMIIKEFKKKFHNR